VQGRDLGDDAIGSDNIEDVQVFDHRSSQRLEPLDGLVFSFLVARHLGVRGAEGNNSFYAKRLGVLGLIPAERPNLGMGLGFDFLKHRQIQIAVKGSRFGVVVMNPDVSCHSDSLSRSSVMSFYSLKWTSRMRRPSSVRAPWGEMPARFRV